MNNMLFSVFHMRWLIQWIHINITDQEKSVSRCHTKCFVHRTMCSQQFPSVALSPTMFSSETEQRGMRGIWHGGSFKIQHIKCKMKWGVGMRGGVKLTVRCSATLGTDGTGTVVGKAVSSPLRPLIFRTNAVILLQCALDRNYWRVSSSWQTGWTGWCDAVWLNILTVLTRAAKPHFYRFAEYKSSLMLC